MSAASKPRGWGEAEWGVGSCLVGGSCLPQLPAGAVLVTVTVTVWASAHSRRLKEQGGNVRQSWPRLS